MRPRSSTEGPKTYQDHQGGKQNKDFLNKYFGPQWPLGLVSRGVRYCNMTGLMCPSFCSAELPRRPILRAIGAKLLFEKILVLLRPWWSWYVSGPSVHFRLCCKYLPSARFWQVRDTQQQLCQILASARHTHVSVPRHDKTRFMLRCCMIERFGKSHACFTYRSSRATHQQISMCVDMSTQFQYV